MWTNENHLDIASIIFNYFEAVRRKWGDAWESRSRGAILNRTNRFLALMRVLRPLYLKLGRPGDVVAIDLFKRAFDRVEIQSLPSRY
jgi:hypothetical protein